MKPISHNNRALGDNLGESDAARKAIMAFDVYAALRRAEAERPSLADNPYWRALRDEAMRDFAWAFEAV